MEDLETLKSNLSEDILTFIDKKDFVSAFNKANSTEQKTVVDIFLSSNIYWNRIKNAEPMLERICLELGLDRNDNPFLTFIDKYCSSNSSNAFDLDNDDFVVLNNLYARSVIEFNDIAGTNYEGTKSVLFNGYLYQKSRDDIDFIITTYMWLGESYNVKRMNFVSIMKDTRLVSGSGKLRNSVSTLLDDSFNLKEGVSVQDVRNAVIYQDADNIKGELTSVKDLKTLLTDASSNVGKDVKQSQTTSVNRIFKDISKLSNKDREELINLLKGEE